MYHYLLVTVSCWQLFQVVYETRGHQQLSSLPLQQEMFFPQQQPAAVYDSYDDYRSGQRVHRPTRIDSASDGVYRGEIQLDSMSRGRSRGSYGEQETRFM